MFENNIPLDAPSIDRIRSLRKALGPEEFDRQFPGVEVYETEITIRHESEHEWKKILQRLGDTPIPPRNTVVALDDFRRSIAKLETEKRQLLESLDKANAKAARVKYVLSTLVALLGIAVTYLGSTSPC